MSGATVTGTGPALGDATQEQLHKAAKERPMLPDFPRSPAAQIQERDRRRALSEDWLFHAYGVEA